MPMLKRALVVGVGGSGGATARIVRQELVDLLRRTDPTLPFPRGWQFLHIDTPPVPDGNDAALPPQLPIEQFVGLSNKGMRYSAVVREVLLNEKLVETTAPWLPDPIEGNEINLQAGAGQYRAIGRTLLHYARMRIRGAIGARIEQMSSDGAQEDMTNVTRALAPRLLAGGTSDPTVDQPLVFVVSSIAGGSGSGMFLDICDFVRGLLPSTWGPEHVAAVLFAPDTFANLKGSTKNGVQGNALAALTELISAKLGRNTNQAESVLMEVSGFERPLDLRGPSETFIIGRSNGRVAFKDPNGVFFAAGKAIAACISDAGVQDKYYKSVIGNFYNNAQKVDNTPLASENASVLSSFGFASVGLARERFADYATERLAGRAISTLLDAHLASSAFEGDTDDEKIRKLGASVFGEFKRKAELQEAGEARDIIEAIAKLEAAAKVRRRSALADQVAQRSEIAASSVQKWVGQHFAAQVDEWKAQSNADIRTATARWATDIQPKILAAIGDVIGRYGIRVGAHVLDLMIAELMNQVLAEFRRTQGESAQKADDDRDWLSRIGDSFRDMKEKVSTSDQRVTRFMEAGLSAFSATVNAELFRAAGMAVEALCTDFLEPLKSTLEREAKSLRSQSASVAGRRSDIQRWQDAERDVPLYVRPPLNEKLIEPWEAFPATYEQLVRDSADEQAGLGWRSGEDAAIRDVILGEPAGSGHPWCEIERTWRSASDALSPTGTSGQAAFRLHLGAEDVLARSRTWVEDGGRPIGRYVREGLKEYLNPSDRDVDATEKKRRLDEFQDRFTEALSIASPLVDLDHEFLGQVHGSQTYDPSQPIAVLSELPFPEGHPARERVVGALSAQGISVADEMFGEDNAQKINISTFFQGGLNPFVFASLTRPVAESLTVLRSGDGLGEFWKWRRARQLPGALPLDPTNRQAMIRGWWIARTMGHLLVSNGTTGDPSAAQPPSVWIEGAWRAFPSTWLGAIPYHPAEVLPAVLETLPEALIDASAAKSYQVLAPYEQLLRLGLRGPSARNLGGDVLPKPFTQWLEDGQAPEGGSFVPPAIAEASDPATRSTAAADYLVLVRESYLERAEAHPPRSDASTRPPLDRELVADLATVLAQLANDVRELPRAQGGKVTW